MSIAKIQSLKGSAQFRWHCHTHFRSNIAIAFIGIGVGIIHSLLLVCGYINGEGLTFISIVSLSSNLSFATDNASLICDVIISVFTGFIGVISVGLFIVFCVGLWSVLFTFPFSTLIMGGFVGVTALLLFLFAQSPHSRSYSILVSFGIVSGFDSRHWTYA